MNSFTTKKYDKALDDKNRVAEDAVYRSLLNLDGVTEVTKFPFGNKDVDFKVTRWGETKYIEVERRSNWGARFDEWPPFLLPIRVPARKRKLAYKYPGKLVYYAVREDNKRAAVFNGDRIVDNAPVKIGEHKYGDGDEGFVEITGEVEYQDLE